MYRLDRVQRGRRPARPFGSRHRQPHCLPAQRVPETQPVLLAGHRPQQVRLDARPQRPSDRGTRSAAPSSRPPGPPPARPPLPAASQRTAIQPGPCSQRCTPPRSRCRHQPSAGPRQQPRPAAGRSPATATGPRPAPTAIRRPPARPPPAPAGARRAPVGTPPPTDDQDRPRCVTRPARSPPTAATAPHPIRPGRRKRDRCAQPAPPGPGATYPSRPRRSQPAHCPDHHPARRDRSEAALTRHAAPPAPATPPSPDQYRRAGLHAAPQAATNAGRRAA